MPGAEKVKSRVKSSYLQIEAHVLRSRRENEGKEAGL